MNQGGDSVPAIDSRSIEYRPPADASQGHAPLHPVQNSWPPPAGQPMGSWNYSRNDNGNGETEVPSSSGYAYDPHTTAVQGEHQYGMNNPTYASAPPSTSEASAAQGYHGYQAYASQPDPNAYNMPSGYQNHYYYQQPAVDAYSQQVGASTYPGAPNQSLSSYVGHASYSTTYNSTGDHQTAAGYNYGSQANYWNSESSGSYAPQHYTSYTPPDTNFVQATSTAASSTSYYQQQYNPWSYPSATNGSGAVGTENPPVAAAAAPVAAFPGQGVGGYPYPSNQPPPPGTTSWKRDSGASVLPSLQEKRDTTPFGAPGVQNQYNHQFSSCLQKPLDTNPPLHDNCENQQRTLYSQGASPQLSSTNQISENFQPPLQNVAASDTRRVSKLQIPTNPRIAPSLVLGTAKTEKETAATSTAMKPAYISVSVPQLNNKVSSHADAGAMPKGTLPPPLQHYVFRTFDRCMNDAQRDLNQDILKEMIKNTSADGTIFTKNWDIEPLFPLTNTSNVADGSNVQSSVAPSSLPRRAKSRWEPISEEKLVENISSANKDSVKDVNWGHLKGAARVIDIRKPESKENGWNGIKFLPSQHQTPMSKILQRPTKKPRFADTLNETENGDAASDSDKEQSLTKYYASAITLADTPEERKRREHRSKRFEKGREISETKHIRAKVTGAGNTYIRKPNVVPPAKNYEDGGNRAVEDIDWDAHTVKGTCQEVEKRYLRLTSAPDPATVRPEEILEKALVVVQTSQKNYLYKCDQLKSIRQDLTVQRIQNELTVKVYETHARLSLEAGDLPEYNQCQSQLKRLYADGIKGSHMEFSAYHLLCVILHSNNKRDLLSSMARLSDEAKDDEAVKHALAVRSAVSSGNYIQFFRLYKEAPNLNTCLMDLCSEKMRFEAIKCMSKSYRPTVPVVYIARVLSFSRSVQAEDGQYKDMNGLEECAEWLRAHGAILTFDNNGELQLDTKASSSSLYMPEPDDAVAHGDATLAVDNFLTRAS